MNPPRRHRACNACRLRKVRCNPSVTEQPRCRECEHLNLRCEYPAAAPRSRRNGRGVVIREYQSRLHDTNGIRTKVLQPSTIEHPSPQLLSHPGEQPFLALLYDYELFVYPFYPIITAQEARDIILSMHQDREAEAFVYALSAATISLAHSFSTSETDEASVVLGWLSKATAVLPGVMSLDDFTIRRIVLVEFIHTSLVDLGRIEPALHYLQQAITMVEALRLGDAGSASHLPAGERARRQRLYHLMFIHERYFALSHHHRFGMAAVEWLPEADDTIPTQIRLGFNQIIGLFRHIDTDMLDAWFAVTDKTATINPSWVEGKHRQLETEPAGSAEYIADLWGMQQADLIITKHWMRMLLWQISLSRHMLSSRPDGQQAMSLLFPVGVSTQLRVLIGQVSRQEISILGSGIQQKLFELTDTIASVVLTVSKIDADETRQCIDDFRFLFDFWRTLPRLNATQLDILQDKDLKITELAI